MYRTCDHPITSFGVICYRVTARRVQYLLVRRKDSLCFVEFLRGKYTLQRRDYISHLLSNMTVDERAAVRAAASFDDLWMTFWKNDRFKNSQHEYNGARQKFDALKRGYHIRVHPDKMRSGDEAMRLVNLESLLAETHSDYHEPEWGFPKGRRNINEPNIKCALREFREETGVDPASITLSTSLKPVDEVFAGCNMLRYRHEYYIARYNGVRDEAHGDHSEGTQIDVVPMLPAAAHKQAHEISCVAWMTADAVLAKIRPRNVERIELFKRVHAAIAHAELGG
jgi:ADP-ribose pyrophosphatase YjhB (NUDIX family)